jgi:DNA-binding GntR family transcriptional regulator
MSLLRMQMDSESSMSDQAIYERIVESVLDHRLPPGTRLTEDKLGSIFGVSRTRIKPILVRLANEKIITLAPNRGASVAQPTHEESKEVFETRRLIEPVLLRRFMQHAKADDIAELSRMVAQERIAQDQGDMHKAIGLSGEFHLYIAHKAQHETMGRILHELVSRTCLIIMTWGSPNRLQRRENAACGCQEHRQLLDAIRLRDQQVAVDLLLSHLNTIELQLNFHIESERAFALEAMLKDI